MKISKHKKGQEFSVKKIVTYGILLIVLIIILVMMSGWGKKLYDSLMNIF